eukprot:jgi/Antlo1/1404/1371
MRSDGRARRHRRRRRSSARSGCQCCTLRPKTHTRLRVPLRQRGTERQPNRALSRAPLTREGRKRPAQCSDPQGQREAPERAQCMRCALSCEIPLSLRTSSRAFSVEKGAVKRIRAWHRDAIKTQKSALFNKIQQLYALICVHLCLLLRNSRRQRHLLCIFAEKVRVLLDVAQVAFLPLLALLKRTVFRIHGSVSLAHCKNLRNPCHSFCDSLVREHYGLVLASFSHTLQLAAGQLAVRLCPACLSWIPLALECLEAF